ncbi:serine/threonine-protein kinase [Streptomyces sp. NPDC060194]|uniref:serine/threonine-protein kinase n=1 Tax=Streptomyces sp. NPDC060194 TaxID=3347069 RepID=UPI0036657887
MKVRQWALRPDQGLTANTVGGRYRIDRLIGQGGDADVHEGFDLRQRRPVAVKIFRPGGDRVTDRETERRFTDEAELLARVRHPGLVAVHDSGRQDEGKPYLVMELVKGSTLRRRILQRPLTPDEVRPLGAALASALAHVHASGVVHRDVKPANILLDEDGRPHLADFGISRTVDRRTGLAGTATGPLIGTAAYLAPEQVRGQPAGPAADVYALGLVLLECLKGELEYHGAPLEAAIARMHRPPAFPAGVPSDLVRLLRAMTALEADDRPSAQACAQALSAVPAAATPAPATPAASAPRPAAPPAPAPGPRHRRARVPASAGAVLVALLGVASLTGSVGTITAGDAPDPVVSPGGALSELAEVPAPAPKPSPGVPAEG